MSNTNQMTPIDHWREKHGYLLDQYYKGSSYVPYLPPQVAVQLPVLNVLDILHKKLGSELYFQCFNLGKQIPSKAEKTKNGDWLKSANIVGVNIRTIGNFFNLVKYALTLSKSQDCLHLLPIWEPGVVNSLYGKVSWNINQKFFSDELARILPHLDSVEKQLKVCINLLHALGKTVGLDVIPHCDRYSEIVLSNPRYFEWVQIQNGSIVKLNKDIPLHVETILLQFIKDNGTGIDTPLVEALFDPQVSDQYRCELLFGPKWDSQKRQKRRIALMQELLRHGYETLPVTMAPPYRGLHIDPSSYQKDEYGNTWYEFKFNTPQEMSRVFGPLTRYKFYETKEDQWDLNFKKPLKAAWEYIARQYHECVQHYGFDFMRGDMAHVQPRPSGVPKEIGPYYDPLKFIKEHIQKDKPHFAFYAETFLTEDNFMAYGNEVEHLNAIKAEATLGNLQSDIFGSDSYQKELKRYVALAANENFTPTLTILTSDKDDPRFDHFFKEGSLARMFLAYFITDMPSYFSLGFETRERNLVRNKNETYTKLYVFTITDDHEVDKVTKTPFIWSKNWAGYRSIEKLKLIFEDIYKNIRGKKIKILQMGKVLVWTQAESPQYIFTVAFDKNSTISTSETSALSNHKGLICIYREHIDFQCQVFELPFEVSHY